MSPETVISLVSVGKLPALPLCPTKLLPLEVNAPEFLTSVFVVAVLPPTILLLTVAVLVALALEIPPPLLAEL